LRAAVQGQIRILFPFIGGPGDLRLAKRLVVEARESLRREGLAFVEHVLLGLTLEIPSAALSADLLAPEVDFFSIGTNDLVQYLLAVDRADPRVAAHYEALHPAVLRTIRHAVESAAIHGRPLSVCGEMAADPLQALLLVGLGVRELSMSPAAIPRVKAALRASSLEAAREAAVVALRLPNAAAIEGHLRRALGHALPEALPVHP
jgi:phosphotransferase system enzyme I (PtsI)